MISKGWLIAGLVMVVAVGVAAFVSEGLGSAGGTPAQQLAAWVTRYDLGSSIGTLTADAAAVDRVAAARAGAGAYHTVCGVLTTDAEAANSNLPTPDTQVTLWLTQAYDLEYRAGVDCYDAASSPAKADASARGRAQAASYLRRALIRIQALTGRSIATTTTTGPGGGGLFG